MRSSPITLPMVISFSQRFPIHAIRRDPVLDSSPNCKRAASVNIDTNVTRLQSVLETKWGRLILPNGSRSQIQNKTLRRSRDSMTSSLT